MLCVTEHRHCNMEDDDTPSGKEGSFGKVLPTTLINLKVDSRRHDLEKEAGLPPNYKVKREDVICGNRGSKETYKHVGNERYRVAIEMRLQRYSRSNRREKSEIVKEIVNAVRAYGGGFVRYDEGCWYDIGNARAREKTGHAIRAALQRHQQKRAHNAKLDTKPPAHAVSGGIQADAKPAGVASSSALLEQPYILFGNGHHELGEDFARMFQAAFRSSEEEALPFEPVASVTEKKRNDNTDFDLESNHQSLEFERLKRQKRS